MALCELSPVCRVVEYLDGIRSRVAHDAELLRTIRVECEWSGDTIESNPMVRTAIGFECRWSTVHREVECHCRWFDTVHWNFVYTDNLQQFFLVLFHK